jgi:hypothetical protein
MAASLIQHVRDASHFARLGDVEWSAYRDALGSADLSPADLPAVLFSLLTLAEQASEEGVTRERLVDDRFWLPLLEKLWRGVTASELAKHLTVEAVEAATQLYRDLGPQSHARHQLLRLLAASGWRPALTAFTELMVTDPPHDAKEVLLAFVPLFQHKGYPPDALFPRLLDALHDATLATVVLDLANYLARSGRVSRHPAADRVERLGALLGGVVGRLARLEEHPQEFAHSVEALNQLVSDSTGLVVALVNALAIIGDTRITGKLHQTLELSHRRIRTEAASALARLGDERGTQVLVEMAAEPVVRLRALAALDEVDQLEQVPEEYRSPEARAAAELAVRLALPTYFGAPPQQIELVDSCRQHWPGYDEPEECFLFHYEYRIQERAFEGIGIAGPMVHAFQADLADLPPGDIYAAYAGWGTEHADISEQPADELDTAEQSAWRDRRRQLVDLGYTNPELIKVGHFFGQRHFIASSQWRGTPGMLVDDGHKVDWFPSTGAWRTVGPTEAYSIVKGRKLLGR